jgi:phosphonatase-like hydrolase
MTRSPTCDGRWGSRRSTCSRTCRADAALAFERAYAELVQEEGVQPIPGARQVIDDLRAAGLRVALTTGFAPATRDILLDALGWTDAVDVALSPVDAGRGRPAPDLVLTALLRTAASSVRSLAVVGDTVSDIESGRRAGAALSIGVLTGSHDRTALSAAGADVVLDSIDGLRGIPAFRIG